MERNMDTVRRIALETEALPPNGLLDHIDGINPEEFAHHVRLMLDAGLIQCQDETVLSDAEDELQVQRLTWAGHEFIDAARDDTLWAKAKANVMKPGLSFSFDVLKDWLKSEITQGFPALRGIGQ